jgi:hypothetical protein
MLDLHEYRDGKVGRRICGISDADFDILEPTFDRFRRKTGARIDLYGDLKLSRHAGQLLDQLRIFLRQEKDPRRTECALELCAILERTIADEATIFFAGD